MTDTLRLRKDKAKEVPGTVEVVYADAWDELCDVAQQLAGALSALSSRAERRDDDYLGSEIEETVRHALRCYEGDS